MRSQLWESPRNTHVRIKSNKKMVFKITSTWVIKELVSLKAVNKRSEKIESHFWQIKMLYIFKILKEGESLKNQFIYLEGFKVYKGEILVRTNAVNRGLKRFLCERYRYDPCSTKKKKPINSCFKNKLSEKESLAILNFTRTF